MAYSIKSALVSIILILLIPILLARWLFFTTSPLFHDTSTDTVINPHPQGNTFHLTEIPISAVLTRALAIANTTRSQGLLTHALLELQNPELTTFAGPGYGVHLRNANRGSVLEAFPDGKLPRCGIGGRYDEWGKVRALRYAYQRIVTLERRRDGGGGGGGLMGDESEKVDSLLMGWSAMLLDRAGVSDPLNPMPPGSRRNAYREAVDRVVGDLTRDGVLRGGNLHGDMKHKTENTEDRPTDDGSERDRTPQVQMKMFHTDPRSVFAVVQFLSIYAVARQDSKWLMEAVEQLQDHIRDSNTAQNFKGLPRGEKSSISTSEQPASGSVSHNSCRSHTDINTWVLAGIVRVLSVVERWTPEISRRERGQTNRGQQYEEWQHWKKHARTNLTGMANNILQNAKTQTRREDEAAQKVLREVEPAVCGLEVHKLADRAIVASSFYRLAQLALLEDHNLLERADGMYDTVARCVQKNGTVNISSDDVHFRKGTQILHGSEVESLVIMMWAARRDCVKLGMCRKDEEISWWSWLTRRR